MRFSKKLVSLSIHISRGIKPVVVLWIQLLFLTGIPAGVVNMVFGLGPKVGEAIVTHPGISGITFTGSTATGQRIQRNSAEHIKKLSLEVGASLVDVCNGVSRFSTSTEYLRCVLCGLFTARR